MILEASSNIPNNPFITRDLETTCKRWIIRTAEGHIGLAPEECEISKWARARHMCTGEGNLSTQANSTCLSDDIICVFLGATIPIVLRKNTTNSTFRIIGYSYLHGLMHGEALLGPLPKPWVAKNGNGLGGTQQPSFYNTETMELVHLESDPLLGPVPDDWE
jgi:hypothetical protein